MDLLIKLFIICCSDGYFIDCYGPFQANQNDAKIFEYIISNDENLKNILQPYQNTFIFLDRGFLQTSKIFYKLQNEYSFKTFIPTCSQLEQNKEELENNSNESESEEVIKKKIKNNKILTTIQTSNSRLVTKVNNKLIKNI